MNAYDLLILLSLGGLLGVIGQGIRAVVGVQKLLAAGRAAEFSWTILGVSLLIGFIAGALSILAGSQLGALVTIPTALAIIGAGYAGTDFIEGFLRKPV